MGIFAGQKAVGIISVFSIMFLVSLCFNFSYVFQTGKSLRSYVPKDLEHFTLHMLKEENQEHTKYFNGTNSVGSVTERVKHLISKASIRYTSTISTKFVIPVSKKAVLAPECDNLLKNMTQGKWSKKIDLLSDKDVKERQRLIRQEIDIEDDLQDFWVKRGIQMGFWRPDYRCGYKNYEIAPPNTTWPQVGSWCNPRGERPCCTNIYKGTCKAPSKATCDCIACVDLRKYLHADVSDWIVDDTRCRWRNYSSQEACDVIESSPFNELHFIGDSFMRNMFRTFLMLLTDDPVRGAWCKAMSREVMEKCTRMEQFFWKDCRQNVVDLSDIIFKHELCGGRGYTNFSAYMEPFYSTKFRIDFLNLTKSKLGKSGSLIILSIGFHMGCVSNRSIAHYLGPAVQVIEDYYGGPVKSTRKGKLSGRWPQIILALPLTIGLLKPTRFLVVQNEHKCGVYSKHMKEYAAKHDIRVLDFRKLTTMVHSFDGTHHGMNVNLIKNQILLNYIAGIDG